MEMSFELNAEKRRTLIAELMAQEACQDQGKDILVVVHNQIDYIRQFVESLFRTTKNFHLYLWDNASDQETKAFLEQVRTENPNVTLHRSEENLGFIVPNNELAKLGTNPWVILLNSDTCCKAGWDHALLGFLQQNPKYGVCGYQGGLLNEDGLGAFQHWGEDVDYVMGWCLCIRRSLYEQIGLFDQTELQFAYAEDSDFGLRARAAGALPYALHLDYMLHFGGATYRTVSHQENSQVAFIRNHGVVKRRWRDYLTYDRVLLKKTKLEECDPGLSAGVGAA